MGLDMYLQGKLDQIAWHNSEAAEKRDGKIISSITVDLGYWRKHPDLHGYIVQTFAGGKDECQDIYLNAEALANIIEAVENDALAHGTTGFFFGASLQPGEQGYSIQKDADLKILREAQQWLADNEAKAIAIRDSSAPDDEKPAQWFPSINYSASW